MRHPGASKLSKMGVTYKPTIRYKMSSPEPNILKNPELDAVMAQVDTHRSTIQNNFPISPRVDIGLLDSPEVESKSKTLKSAELLGQ